MICESEIGDITDTEKTCDDVFFVLLSFDDSFKKANAFDNPKDYRLPIYATVSHFLALFQSSDLPTTYIIDADGNLALTHKRIADDSDPEFKEFINSLK